MFWRWKSIGLTIGGCLSKKHLAKVKAYFVDKYMLIKANVSCPEGQCLLPQPMAACSLHLYVRKNSISLPQNFFISEMLLLKVLREGKE